MAVTFHIEYEPHGKIVTCQRPIVLTVAIDSGAVAHFRASLWRNTLTGFQDTGITMNAYNDNIPTNFSFNVAEYTRHFFEEAQGLYSNIWCTGIDEACEQEFKLRVFPVEYTSSGNLDPQPNNYLETTSFVVIPTSTKADESTSTLNDNIRLDRFVFNGDNGSSAPALGQNNLSLLSNMPNGNVIDVDAGFHFHHQFLHDPVAGTTAELNFTNDSGGAATLSAIYNKGYQGFIVHPLALDFLVEIETGVASNLFFDTNGNLTSKTLNIRVRFLDAGGSAIQSTPVKTYKLVQGLNCKGSTTFIFRNMRGGFDFFTATGTQEVSTELSGSEFDRHTDFDRSNAGFGLKRGQHNMTNLWNNRKEIYSIFSQPLTKEYALWVEELIMSPQVWVVRDIENYTDTAVFADSLLAYKDKGLVAVNISKGSYKLHTTEKNVNFVEFKYALSENTITQKM